MTPIEMPWLATTCSMLSALRTAWPAIVVPTAAGSESSSAAIRNPRDANPP